ncbi:MAG: phage tail protein [Liquorilactobacillus nagelii]|uniref:phage tail protein n=1 Tax=Lactobacillaceae TaxID=33958 RepID=UPI0039E75684
MELEELEVLFKVNTEALQPTLDKIQSAFSNFGMKVSGTTKSSMEKTESNLDLSKGLAKVQQQLAKMNETVSSYFNRAAESANQGADKVSQNAGKMFSGTQQKVKKDLDSVISTINSKMDQARAAQSKVNELLSQKNSLSNDQQKGKQGIQIDNQVASAQAQMTRYQNQAKALAQAMQREFNAIPDSLKRIASAMDENEVKINTLRNQLKRLQQSYQDTQGAAEIAPGNKRTQSNLTSLENSMMSTRDKMSKLINANDELAQSYAYVEDRAKPLKSALAQISTELNSTEATASKSSNIFSRLGSSMGNFGNRMRNIGSSIREATSGMNMFGNSSESSMNRATRSGRDYYSVLGSIKSQLMFLPSMLLVYGLLYNGIIKLTGGMAAALKTNQQFASSLNQIKANLMIAFYPIYSAALPAINAMMSAISKATSWIAQFTSALFGMSYSTAKKGASGLYSQIQAMNDTSKASKAAADQIKEANKQIKEQNRQQAEAVKQANEQIQAQNRQQAAAVKQANEQIQAQNHAQELSAKHENEQIREQNRQASAQVKADNAQITASNKAAAESYEQQKKAAEDLSNTLMGFDELNVLDKNQANDLEAPEKQALESYQAQPTVSSPDLTPTQSAPDSTPTQPAPESTPLESADDAGDAGDDSGINFDNTPNTIFDSAADSAKKLKKILGELFDPMKEAWDAKGKDVMDAAKYAADELGKDFKDVGKSFMDVWTNGTGKETMENLLQLVADLLNIIGDIGKAFDEAWRHGDAGTDLIQTMFNSLNDVLRLLHDIATSFRQAFNDNGLGEKIFANLIQLATDIFKIIGDIAKAFDNAWTHGDAGTKLFQAMLTLVNTFIKTLDGIAKAFDEAWNKGNSGQKVFSALITSATKVIDLLNDIATSFKNAFKDSTGQKILSDILGIAKDVFQTIGNFASQFDKAWQHGNTGTSIFKTLLGMVSDITGALKDMADYTVQWSSKLNFAPLLKSIDNLLQAIRPIAKDVWDGLDWGYKNVLLPLAKFTITQLIPNFLNLLAAALKAVNSIINAAKPAFQWIWDSFWEPIAKWTGGVIVSVMKDLASVLSGLADVIDKHKTAFELVAKAIVTMLTVKLVAGGLDKGVGLVGKLVDSATVLSGNKHLLMDFFGKITGLSDLKSAVTGLKTIKDVTKELVIQNWQNFVSDAKNLASLTWSSFTKIGALLIDLSKVTWGEFMTYVNGMKKLAQMSWSGLVTAASAIKNWGGWAKLAAAGQTILNAAMDLNPYVLLALAVAAVVAALVELYKHDKKFRDFCNDIYKSITQWLGDAITWLKKNWAGVALLIINPVAGGLTLLYNNNPKFAKWVDDLWKGMQKNMSSFHKNWDSFWGTVNDKIQDLWNKGTTGWDNFWKSTNDNLNKNKNKSNFQKSWNKFWDDLHTNMNNWWTNLENGWNDFWRSVGQSFAKNKDKSNFNKSWNSFWSTMQTNMSKWWSGMVSGWNDFWRSVNQNLSKNRDKGSFSKGWQSFWSGIGKYLHDTWTEAQKNTQSAWSDISNKINQYSQSAKKNSSSAWEQLKTNTSNAWNSLRGNTSNWWSSISSKIGGYANSAKGNALGAWNTLRNNTPSYFNDIQRNVNGAWSNIVNGSKGLGRNIASGIRSGFGVVKDAMADLKKYLINPVKSAIGKIKDGINWVLKKVGGNSVGWGWFNWAKGTNSHPGGLAMVNDQQGPSYRESFELPNGKQGIFPDVRNLVLPLPKGTKVKTASETQKTMSQIMPRYAGGIGDFNFDFSGLDALSKINWGDLFSGIGSGIGDIWDGVTDEFDSILSDVSHPKKLLDYMVNKFMDYDYSWSTMQTNLAKGTVKTEENGLMGWAKNIMKKFGVGTQTGPGASGWTDAVKKALAKLGLPTTSNYVSAWVRQIQTESGGNEKAMGGTDGLSDGHAEGLLQVKPPTFAAYHLSGFNDIWKGYDNMLAGINYAIHRYGRTGMLDVIGHGHGYENGGYGDQQGLYPLFEGNKPEIVLPLTNKERTLDLIQQALKFIGVNFSNGFQMPKSLTNPIFLTNVDSVSTQSTAANMSGGGVNELGTTIVNALMQGLQMNNLGGTNSNQPININLTLNVGNDKFGEAAIKGINAVNAKNHRNMLNL